jgi:hypothetical protein
MFLVRLIYVSEVTESLDEKDIEQILASARKNNPKYGLTGMLCFHNRYFLQCLEGARSEVNKVYQVILKDPRHSNIVLLEYKELVKREFESWTMGYVPECRLTQVINMRFSGNGVFSPYEMLGESCHQMMIELKEEMPFI